MELSITINPNFEKDRCFIEATAHSKQIEQITHILNEEHPHLLIAEDSKGTIPLALSDIYYCFSENKLVYAQTAKQAYEVKYKLYELEDRLSAHSFIRISKSAIANIQKIDYITLAFNSTMTVHFKNEMREQITRSYLKKVKQYLGM
ncbi:LytTR family DNA-binding domain-containing protein [Bacillus sp. JCM 19041]|uniref:LytTR family DNA-binding domain-containing protein n=1 Tax=Bacillus sp. JCM 19041 TaxID=1460637 RepID=UPI0006D007EF